jgi:hypothetical protein
MDIVDGFINKVTSCNSVRDKRVRLTIILCSLFTIHYSLSNAQTWSVVGSGITGHFKCFAEYHGSLYAGGIDSVNGKRTDVAKWDGNKWSAVDTGQIGHVISMITFKGKLYVGTEYSESGMTFGRILCWDDTNWTVSASLNGKVTCFALHDSVLYVGGFFTNVDTVRARHIAKWSDSLGHWVRVNRGGVDGKILTLTSYHKKLYAGGQFSFVTCWDGKSWEDVRGNGPNLISGWVQSFAIWNDDLYAAGQFDYVCHWDGGKWNSLGAFNDVVGSLALYNNELYAGGDFTGIPQYDHAYHIAKFGGMNWDCVGGVIYWGGDCKPYTGTVWSMYVYKGDLYIGGEFMIAVGKVMMNVAKWTKPLPIGNR